MPTRQEQAQEFRLDEDKDALENLTDFLEPYGLGDDLSDEKYDAIFDAENQLVDVGRLRDFLPETLEDGENGAYVEVDRFYESIPRVRRAGGVEVHADKLLSLLMERMEFFGHLVERVSRTCRGQQCGVYDACPFTDDGDGLQMVENATPEGDLQCMVDRQEINRLKDYLLDTADGGGGKVDPRRPAQALLFEHLADLVINRRRMLMKIQQEEIMVDVPQAVQTQPSGVEELQDAGVEAHPILEQLETNMRRIESVMEKMGISPQFEMRNDMWIEEDDEGSAELRAREMTQQFLREARDKIKEDLPPGSEQRKIMEKMVEKAENKAKEYDPDEDDE